MEVDPEALIKCTTITPGGVASNTPALQGDKVVITSEEVLAPKEEPVQIQIDDQTQLTIKTAQNKMLADLLEKKSNPPVQVVQMNPQINAPTIQITETGQIVQVKSEANPVIQINADTGSSYFQIKNEQGQLIQIKNEQGQIIQLKNDQMQNSMLQFKNDQGQIVQIKNDGQNLQAGQILQQSVIQTAKNEKDQIMETVVTDHSYTEPPTKKIKVEEKREGNTPQESVSKTAANLYAALAASALEDEEDLLPNKQEPVEVPPPVMVAGSSDTGSVIIQEPLLQVHQPSMQVQQPTMQVQQPTLVQQPTMQMQQPTLQMQQPMLQVQPMDVQNILASQSILAGQIILQGGLGYIAQNIPGNMMQKTIIIVQGPTGGGPLTLTVNNPAGLDEATLNSLITQATEAITQQQIIQNTPQITASQQPIITSQPQPHKAQIVTSQTQQIVVSKQAPALISTSTSNQMGGNQIIQSGNQIIQSGNQIIQSGNQIIQGNQQIIAVSNNQQIIMNAPLKPGVHRVMQPQRSQVVNTVTQPVVSQSEAKSTVIQSSPKPQQPIMRQVITRQPIMVGNTKIGDKEVVTQTVEKPPTPKPTVTPPPVASTSLSADDTPWICHWRGCGKSFSNASEVFSHAARTHCPTAAGGEAACMWLDCDRVPRKTFALLNHLTDKHCTDENEGPVTKSIRLTAALILRNIVIYSNTGRRQLRTYEAHLASIALSTVEASRTIAQVLYDMNNI
ncbi:AT-rich interactive domain-containing protein 2 [Papilio machaon]|uniref:AT-rich interactive domain-containing protein 2 n=1 Tax=Papilio machaon TaxID=76193 RepID=A0A0N1IC16_PAPMA|nr:AT-rich interactive domain-containing protein 2 [Papilio machaon]